MNKLEHKTTEEHYNKYRDMANRAGITLRNRENYFGYAIEALKDCYIEDNFLNNIPLYHFDSYYHFYLSRDEKRIITNLADNVCVFKHLLIYEVLEATPIFVEVGKNYKDYPPLKK